MTSTTPKPPLTPYQSTDPCRAALAELVASYSFPPPQNITEDFAQCEARRAAWAAARSALALEAVPPGFVMVPKEPTEEMIDAGCDVDARGEAVAEHQRKFPALAEMASAGQELAIRYRAMLAASQDTKERT